MATLDGMCWHLQKLSVHVTECFEHGRRIMLLLRHVFDGALQKNETSIMSKLTFVNLDERKIQ